VGYALSILEDKIGGPPVKEQSKPKEKEGEPTSPKSSPKPRKWIMCVAPTDGERCPWAVVDTAWANFCCLGIISPDQFPVLNPGMYAELLKSEFGKAEAKFSYSLEVVQSQINNGCLLTGQSLSMTLDAVAQKKDPDWHPTPSTGKGTPKKKAPRLASDSSPTLTPDPKKAKTAKAAAPDKSTSSSDPPSGRRGIPTAEVPTEDVKPKEDREEEEDDEVDNTISRTTRAAGKNLGQKVGKAKAKANRESKPAVAKLKPAGLARLKGEK
jgi:hypothetical protein